MRETTGRDYSCHECGGTDFEIFEVDPTNMPNNENIFILCVYCSKFVAARIFSEAEMVSIVAKY